MSSMPNAPQASQPSGSPSSAGGSAVKIIVAVLVILAIAVGAALIIKKRHARTVSAHHKKHHEAVTLDGPTATIDLGDGTKMEFVRVPSGEFLMGAPGDEPESDVSEMDNAGKQHKVTIKSAFYLGKYEVTRAQYKAVMGYDPSAFKDAARFPNVATNMNLPADQVSWGDAHKWCDEVAKRTGLTVRLPSEAEWEYACRAGTTSAYSSGEKLSTAVAQFDPTDAKYVIVEAVTTGPSTNKSAVGAPSVAAVKPKSTAPVGTHRPNAWGLYDMHGNVSEWVEDAFHDNYEGAPTDGSVWQNKEKPWLKVHRGGSYNNTAPTCRSAMREAGGGETEPDLRTSMIGFRVVIAPGK